LVPNSDLWNCYLEVSRAEVNLLDPTVAPRAGERFAWRLKLEALCRQGWLKAGEPEEWSPRQAAEELEHGLDTLRGALGLLA
jgi:hypothetical protein